MANLTIKAAKSTATKAPGTKATAKKASKRVAKPKAAKAPKPAKIELPTHGINDSYTTSGGVSPTIRGHGKRLSAVRTDLKAATVTPRDESFIADIRAKYGTGAFSRYDADAGCVRRAVSHGFLKHVSGDLSSRTAQFQLTDAGRQYGAAKS